MRLSLKTMYFALSKRTVKHEVPMKHWVPHKDEVYKMVLNILMGLHKYGLTN